MPVNRTYPLKDLLAACAVYTGKTGRIITFEYTLIRDVNDSPALVEELADRLSAFPCRVNLIPLSPVEDYKGKPSSPDTARRFIEVLRNHGINTTLRWSQGSNIHAACGQLKARHPRISA